MIGPDLPGLPGLDASGVRGARRILAKERASVWIDDSKTPKITRVVKSMLKAAPEQIYFFSRILEVIQNIGQFFKSSGLAGTRIFGIFTGLAAASDMVESTKSAVKAKTISEKVQHSAFAVLSAGYVVDAATDVSLSLQVFGAVSRSAGSWVSVVGPYLLPVQVATAGLSIWSIKEIVKQRNELIKIEEELEKSNQETKFAEKVFTNLKEHPETFLYKQSAKVTQVADKALEEMRKDPKAMISESKHLMKEMKARVTKRLAVEIAETVVKVAAVALGIAAFFSPIGPAIWLLIIAAGLIGVGFSLYKRYLLTEKVPINFGKMPPVL